MMGKNVLHTLGYDAFGLPAEQYAVQTGQHPRKTTEENMVTMRRQLRRLGLGHDDRRAITTIDPSFYSGTPGSSSRSSTAGADESAAVGRESARPISELVAALESGEGATPPACRGCRCPPMRSASSSMTTGWPTPPRRR